VLKRNPSNTKSGPNPMERKMAKTKERDITKIKDTWELIYLKLV
jgi:hypothetical protein